MYKLTSEQTEFLKWLRRQPNGAANSELEALYPEDVISRTFDLLLRDGYITSNDPPIITAGTDIKRRFIISDKGENYLLAVSDKKRSDFLNDIMFKWLSILLSSAALVISICSNGTKSLTSCGSSISVFILSPSFLAVFFTLPISLIRDIINPFHNEEVIILQIHELLADALSELRLLSRTIHDEASSKAVENKCGVFFLGAEFNYLTTVEVKRFLETSRGIDVDMDAINDAIPAVCKELNIKFEPLQVQSSELPGKTRYSLLL